MWSMDLVPCSWPTGGRRFETPDFSLQMRCLKCSSEMLSIVQARRDCLGRTAAWQWHTSISHCPLCCSVSETGGHLLQLSPIQTPFSPQKVYIFPDYCCTVWDCCLYIFASLHFEIKTSGFFSSWQINLLLHFQKCFSPIIFTSVVSSHP